MNLNGFLILLIDKYEKNQDQLPPTKIFLSIKNQGF